jgi:hypothetical protein
MAAGSRFFGANIPIEAMGSPPNVRFEFAVLLVCDEAGLIGREMFAIDGLKLLFNVSKEWSGKKADVKKKARRRTCLSKDGGPLPCGLGSGTFSMWSSCLFTRRVLPDHRN